MQQPDFRITYHGTITLLEPLTDACREWITENVSVEGWQWFGRALAVEPRYLNYLVEVLQDEGFAGEE
jgi:hypothetical protein